MLLIALSALLAVTYVTATVRPPAEVSFLAGLPTDRTLVIAHRGGAKMFPENTLFAFTESLALGADILELDVHGSLDGVPVVIHDDTVDRTTNGEGAVRSFPVEELRRLDAAYRFTTPESGDEPPLRGRGIGIPTLREVFEAFPDSHMVVELKENDLALADAIVGLVKELEREDRTLLASFHRDMVEHFRSEAPRIATHACSREVSRFWALSWFGLEGLKSPAYEAILVPKRSLPLRFASRRLNRAAIGRGLMTAAWTVNSPDEMQRLIDLGVRGLITDRPDLAVELAAASR